MDFNVEAPLRILAIAPYDAMKSALLRAAESFPGIQMEAYIGDLEEGAAIVTRLSEENYDVIISRGGTAKLIRPITALPVIDIPVSVYDVLRVIKLSENYTEKCAVVGFQSVTESAHTLCNLLRKDIPIRTVVDAASAESALEELNSKGVHTILCDNVTHRIARSRGMNAMLITSGESSLREALQEAVEQGATFRRIRNENEFMRSIIQMDSRVCVAFDAENKTVFSFSSDVPEELISIMRRKIPSVKDHEELLFYHQSNSVLHTITAAALHMRGRKYILFRDQPDQISLRSRRPGIRAIDAEECEQAFMNSFFSISGSLGELDQRLTPISSADKPVLMIGEEGTGKEQIARLLYLRSRMRNHPFITIDGASLNERGWDFLLESHASPLSTRNTTIYFQRLEGASPERQKQLLNLIEDANLSRRLWLIFSCDATEGEALPPFFTGLIAALGPMTLQLPTLRERRDEIPALASLYLGNLSVEMNKQISGFDPGALDMMMSYDWPGNYTQFKHLLQELTMVTDGPYISSNVVAELLAQERRKHRRAQSVEQPFTWTGQTMDEITYHIACQALAKNGGNQSLTARQLGISRTTLWRMLSSQGTKPAASSER